MSKRKKRKVNIFTFGRFMLAYSVILIVVAIGVIGYIWSSLANYQAGIDSDLAQGEEEKMAARAPQLTFQNYIAGMTLDDLVTAWKIQNPYCFDSDETIREYLQEKIFDIQYDSYKAVDYSDSKPKYVIKNGDESLAYFTLDSNSGEWSVSDVNIAISGNASAEVIAPVTMKVTCEGIEVGDEYLGQKYEIEVDGYDDQLINPVSYGEFRINNLIKEGDIIPQSDKDNLDVAIDAEGKYQYILQSGGDAYKQEAEGFINALLYYYSQGKNNVSANMANAVSYVASGSEASKIIRQSLDGVTWRRGDNATYTTSTSDVYVVADNCYIVDVTYRKNINSEDEEVKDQIYKVYFLDLGSGFKIYSFGMG